MICKSVSGCGKHNQTRSKPAQRCKAFTPKLYGSLLAMAPILLAFHAYGGGPKAADERRGHKRASQGECSLWLFFSLSAASQTAALCEACRFAAREWLPADRGNLSRAGHGSCPLQEDALTMLLKLKPGGRNAPQRCCQQTQNFQTVDRGNCRLCALAHALLDQRPFCPPLTSPWWVHLPPRRSNSGWDSELGSLRQMGERMHEHTSMHSLASFFLRVGDRGPRLEQV